MGMKGFKICMHSGSSIQKFSKFLFTVDVLSAMGAVNQDYWHVCESSFAKGHAFDALASWICREEFARILQRSKNFFSFFFFFSPPHNVINFLDSLRYKQFYTFSFHIKLGTVVQSLNTPPPCWDVGLIQIAYA